LQNRWYSIEITDPLSADILDLDVISDNFQSSVPTIMDHIWGFFTGSRNETCNQAISYFYYVI